jgi:hypothetical protein
MRSKEFYLFLSFIIVSTVLFIMVLIPDRHLTSVWPIALGVGIGTVIAILIYKRIITEDDSVEGEHISGVTLIGDKILYETEDGKIDSVLFSDLDLVMIEATESSTYEIDLSWHLLDSNGFHIIPNDAHGIEDLLANLQKMPNFNNAACLEAIGTTTPGMFICWSKHDNFVEEEEEEYEEEA